MKKTGNDLYWIYLDMHRRCYDSRRPAYARYGAKGTRVCDEWHNFETFSNDVGKRPSPKHTIDRIDNNKGYSPDNTRWATRAEQNVNKTNHKYYEYNGEKRTLPDWCRVLKLNKNTINFRIRRGKTFLEAISKK